MNTPRPSASGFTFSSCLLCAQVPSGLPDLPDQGPGRRRGEGPRQRGRRPTEPGRLILVGGRGGNQPAGGGTAWSCPGGGRTTQARGVTTGREPSQRSGHSIVQKKTHNRNTRNTGLLLNKWETQLLKVGSFFTWTKQVHICETVSQLHRVLPSRCCSRPTCLPRPGACFSSRKLIKGRSHHRTLLLYIYM